MRLIQKMDFISGICAAKALEQLLCEQFHYSHAMQIFILVHLIIEQEQILRSRGFDEYMPDISSCNYTLRVNDRRSYV
jgi:hypothetical protein